ncbi:MAG TPA: hypothetical protein VE080_01440 [Candidatus Aquicultoraceae bacterium]|nr:hypothetical protein [Candidatus Aquicultoraceae bacterium]
MFRRAAWDVRKATRGGADTVELRQRTRLAALVAFAKERSPFYRERYRHLPARAVDLASLPPVTKPELMGSFKEWITDSEISIESLTDFVSEESRIGSLYLGRYVAFATSGTTGRPAVFVHDPGAASVYLALAAWRRCLALLSPRGAWAALRMGGRSAAIVATGGHFASSVIDGLSRKRFPRLVGRNRTLSLLAPLPDLVRELNAYRPAILGSYPTAMAVLADEQERGSLRISPQVVLTGAERLSPAVRDRIASAFRCPVRDTYAASEFPGIAYDCDHGILHVNADWLVLEPVDREYRPVPPGTPSYTTLLTNLANRVQPVVRYDLGDSVTMVPGPCPCGSPLPAVKVEGRKDEVLRIRSSRGGTVSLLPMALATVVEEAPGVGSYQLIQTGPSRLRLRLAEATGYDRSRTAAGVSERLHRFLASQGLEEVVVEVTEERPVRDSGGGKLRQIYADLQPR